MATASKPRTKKRATAKPSTPPPAARTLETTPVEIPVDRIDPSPFQPRQAVAEEAIEDLASSIATDGLIHPICVRPSPADPQRYELVDGERRLRGFLFSRGGRMPQPSPVHHPAGGGVLVAGDGRWRFFPVGACGDACAPAGVERYNSADWTVGRREKLRTSSAVEHSPNT